MPRAWLKEKNITNIKFHVNKKKYFKTTTASSSSHAGAASQETEKINKTGKCNMMLTVMTKD